MTANIKIEVDTAPDVWDFGGHRVILETEVMWKVLFRGDIAECQQAVEEVLEEYPGVTTST